MYIRDPGRVQYINVRLQKKMEPGTIAAYFTEVAMAIYIVRRMTGGKCMA